MKKSLLPPALKLDTTSVRIRTAKPPRGSRHPSEILAMGDAS